MPTIEFPFFQSAIAWEQGIVELEPLIYATKQLVGHLSLLHQSVLALFSNPDLFICNLASINKVTSGVVQNLRPRHKITLLQQCGTFIKRLQPIPQMLKAWTAQPVFSCDLESSRDTSLLTALDWLCGVVSKVIRLLDIPRNLIDYTSAFNNRAHKADLPGSRKASNFSAENRDSGRWTCPQVC